MIRVMCLGVFDVLHPGHIAHLRAARALGDHLMVAVTADNFVCKGLARPLFTYAERSQCLRELRCVDGVIPFEYYAEVIQFVRPDIYVKGIEYKDNLPEKELVESLGGVVHYLDTKPVYSSTKIMNGEMLRDARRRRHDKA